MSIVLVEPNVLYNMLAGFETVQNGHIKVQEHEVVLQVAGRSLLVEFKSLLPIRSLVNLANDFNLYESL